MSRTAATPDAARPAPEAAGPRPWLAAGFGSVAGVACAFVAAIGVLVLAGWVFNVEGLKTILYPAPVAMNPLTAISFLLCAAALWLKRDEHAGRPAARAAANACAAAAVVLTAVVLVGLAGGWDAHADEWLFRSQLAARPRRNRMAPNTALCFVLCGLALALLDVAAGRRRRRPAQAMVLVAGGVALLALVGYAMRSLAFYNVPSQVPMALNTAVCFAVLCAGILCARLGREPMATLVSNTAGGVVARRLLPAAFGVPLVLGLLLGWFLDRREKAGLPKSEIGLSLFALGNIVAFNLLVWWTARMLYRVDERRRAAEARLHEQNRLLERANDLLGQAVRSERQAHEALKAAQAQLVQTEKLAGLGQMVAGVAHEINNPLAFVANNVAVLQRDVAAIGELLALYREATGHAAAALEPAHAGLLESIRDLCDRIDLTYTLANLPDLMASSREGLKRIKRIVEDLRNFARLDEADLHEVDVNDGVRSTAVMAGPRAAERGVRVDLDLTPLPPVACYPGKVNQVVMNLLANAVDASPAGGTVTIRTAAEDGSGNGDGGWVRIDVVDRGGGIDPAIRGRIFDPFFTTKPVGRGTGLGLSISYRVVKEHGGSIDVESTPGEGSRFTVRLPCRPAVSAPPTCVAPSSGTATPS